MLHKTFLSFGQYRIKNCIVNITSPGLVSYLEIVYYAYTGKSSNSLYVRQVGERTCKNFRDLVTSQWARKFEKVQAKKLVKSNTLKKLELNTYFTVGQKIWKSPGQKNSWNLINQFHEKISWPNSIFCNFKNGEKSIFELGKVLKMQFHEEKNLDLFDFTSFFGWTF